MEHIWKTIFTFFIFSEALALLTQALEFHTRNYGTGHPIVADAMCRVSYVYQVVGEYVLILICDLHPLLRDLQPAEVFLEVSRPRYLCCFKYKYMEAILTWLLVVSVLPDGEKVPFLLWLATLLVRCHNES